MSWAFSSAFERATEGDLTELATSRFGLQVTAVTRLPSERDDTVLLDSTRGRAVLKLAHPDDDPVLLDQRLALMEWLSEQHCPVRTAGVWRSVEGERVATWRGRQASVVEYLPGEPLRRGGLSPADLTHLGHSIASLQEVLASYPGAYVTEHVWNLADLHLLEPAFDAIAGETWRAAAKSLIDLAQETTLSHLSALPVQVCHNDFHGDNVLMDPVRHRVVGLVDWGDSVVTSPLVDVAVAASYARGYLAPEHSSDDPWLAARELASGWESARGLEAVGDQGAPWDLLAELILLRLIQRLVLNTAIARVATDGGVYARRNRERSLADVTELWQTRPKSAFPSMERTPLW